MRPKKANESVKAKKKIVRTSIEVKKEIIRSMNMTFASRILSDLIAAVILAD